MSFFSDAIATFIGHDCYLVTQLRRLDLLREQVRKEEFIIRPNKNCMRG